MGEEPKTLEELEEEGGRLDAEISVAKKRKILNAIDKRMGQKGGWRLFSDNGKLSGFSLSRARAWLKNN